MIRRIKTFLKDNPFFLDVIAFLYSLPVILLHIRLFMSGRVSARSAFLRNVKLSIHDKSGRVSLGRRARIRNSHIQLFSPNNQFVIGGG